MVNRKKGLDVALVLTSAFLSVTLVATPLQFFTSAVFAQEQFDLAGGDIRIHLHLAPSIVEYGQASYNIGFVQLVSNQTGEPVLAPRDLEVELTSRSQSLASVPPKVVISKGTDYAQFSVGVGDLIGESEISALFGNQIVTQTFKVVEAGSQTPNDNNLVINLPSNKMQIGSEMPISVYLENNGEIMQAPEDVMVHFDYERSLIQLSSSSVVIKKGSYYALGTVKSLEKSGNAFVKASTENPVLDTVTTIEISQTQPASLKVYVFPDKVGLGEKTIDIFVTLSDTNGSPTVASNDIKLEMFASSSGVQNIDSSSAVIKKGEFGYYMRQSILFYSSQNVTMGASAEGLGVSTDKFEIVPETLDAGNPKAQNKVLTIYTPTAGMPSDAIAVVGYQLNAIEDDEDDGMDIDGDGQVDYHPIDDLENGKLYPIQSSLLYSAGQGNLNVVTSDLLNLRVTNPGSITAGSSYGTATVASGRQPRSIDVSVSLANTASDSNSLTVTGGLTPVQTKIYSPAGLVTELDYRVPFNQEGMADLFFLTLDSAGRPARSDNGVQYLVQPINELAEIAPDATFASLQVRSSQFSPLESTVDIAAIPVGVNSDYILKAQSRFYTIFSSSIVGNVIFPFESVIGFSMQHHIGAVQLTDLLGNPLLASEDVTIALSSSRGDSISTPSVTIPMGKSFANFDIATSSKAETLTVTAHADGIRSTAAELHSVLADLPGAFVEGSILVATQPSTITVAADEGASVLWGIPTSFEVVDKEDKALRFDPASNSYLASANVVASKSGNYVIDVTLLKDGFNPSRLSSSVRFEAYQMPLSVVVFHDQPSIEYREPVTMNVRVVDANARPVPDAIVRINPGPNATAVPSVATTDAGGIVTFVYTPTGAESNGIVTATAEKAGYNMGIKTTNFEVENVPTMIPSWLIFAAIGTAAAGIGGGSVYRMKKPKDEEPAQHSRSKKMADDEDSDIAS